MRNLRAMGGLVTVGLGLLAGCGDKRANGSSSASSSALGSSSAAAPAPAAMSKEAVTARLAKGGWKVESSEDMDVDYKRVRMKLREDKGEDSRLADLDVLVLGEPFDPAHPKPAVEVGKTAILRVGFIPSAPGAKSPDLEAIKKDIVAKAPPEKVTDAFFFDGYKEAAAKWKLSDQSSRGGGSSWGDVFQNYRYLSGDTGEVQIHAVDAKPGIDKGLVKIVGTNIVWAEADDDALAKKILALATGG